MSKQEKILLLTGASSDIALALIQKVEGNYSKIIAHYYSDDTALLALKEKVGDKLVLMKSDFSDQDSTQQFISEIKEKNLFPDHFCHLPATKFKTERFSKCTWGDFEAEFNISLRSAVLLTEAVLPVMAKQKYGKVVFLLSSTILNQPTVKYTIPYSVCKSALLSLMKGLSAEYADKMITVNGISPSMIETKFLSNTPSIILEQNAEKSPLKRNLVPEDLLSTFSFLLSEESACVTGQNIAVTGGN